MVAQFVGFCAHEQLHGRARALRAESRSPMCADTDADECRA